MLPHFLLTTSTKHARSRSQECCWELLMPFSRAAQHDYVVLTSCCFFFLFTSMSSTTLTYGKKNTHTENERLKIRAAGCDREFTHVRRGAKPVLQVIHPIICSNRDQILGKRMNLLVPSWSDIKWSANILLSSVNEWKTEDECSVLQEQVFKTILTCLARCHREPLKDHF